MCFDNQATRCTDHEDEPTEIALSVHEKCLYVGSSRKFQVLTDEMLGTTDEIEPLQMRQELFSAGGESTRDMSLASLV